MLLAENRSMDKQPKTVAVLSHPPEPMIVQYGIDRLLMFSRGKVLEATGCTVYDVHTLGEMHALLSSSAAIGLLVLCHSLAEEERDTALREMSLHWPGMTGMLLTKSYDQCTRGPGEAVSIFEGPHALVAKVRTLLGIGRQAHAD